MVSQTDIKYAQRLRGLRLGRDIKQTEAARTVGLKDQQTYSKFENGQLPFTDEIISQICRGFSITPEEFTNPNQNISFSNSPNANLNSPNSFNNDVAIIHQLIRPKDEIIIAKENIIALLKNELQDLKGKRS